MAHVEAFGPALHKPFQLTSDALRVIFKGRADRSALEGNAADQDS